MESETTHSVDGLHANKNTNTTSLPSPPPSVNATELDSGRNANGSLSGEAAASDLPESGASESAPVGDDAGIVKTTALIEV